VGMLSAMNTGFLGLADAVAGDLFLVIGALGMSIFVGWAMKADLAHELAQGAGERFARFIPGVVFLVRYVLPPVIAIVLWVSLNETWVAIVEFMAGG
jgi:SNF family Na+-dependent transporter